MAIPFYRLGIRSKLNAPGCMGSQWSTSRGWATLSATARWGFQGVVGQERLAIADESAWIIDLKNPSLQSAGDYVFNGKFKCATAQIASETMNGAWGFSEYDQIWLPFAVSGAMVFCTMILLFIVLKRRDPV